MAWRLLAAGEDRLPAVPFHGPFPAGGDLGGAPAAVLAVYPGRDDRVNATRDPARRALAAAGLRHHVVIFTDADHAFFNDTGARFDAPAAEGAYRRLIGWLDRTLARRR
jgi:carboxymethylenebutenolidase